MTEDEFKQKIYERLEELQRARKNNSVVRLELLRLGSRLHSLCQSLQHSLVTVSMTRDGNINSGGSEISRQELNDLPDKLSSYLETEKEIKELEACLVEAGYGNLIGKS